MGGHKSFRNFGSRVRNLIAYFVDRWALAMFRKKIQVPINAGDCVIFDSRIPHRSSPATAKNGSLVSVERSKIVLYWDVAGRLDDAKNFILNSTVRAVTESDSFESFSYLGHNFPDSYPPEYIDLVGSIGPIVIAGPESNIRRFFKIDKC